MECLEKVQNREADFLVVDPEDMYVAFKMKDEEFSVFSEIRTIEEPNGNFVENVRVEMNPNKIYSS